MQAARARQELAEILQLAHSGELAAIYAYRGHARSLRDPAERRCVTTIEHEELQHRIRVREMLDEIGVVPSAWHERKLAMIGRIIGALCRVGGWFVPMYGAGKLESRNVGEYEVAARHAAEAGFEHFVDDLLEMAEVEWEHERYFREIIESHPLRRFFARWPVPPPKEEIRASFALWAAARAGQAASLSRSCGGSSELRLTPVLRPR